MQIPFANYLIWFSAGLVRLLPHNLRQKFGLDGDVVDVRLDDETLWLNHLDGRGGLLAALELNLAEVADVSILAESILQWRVTQGCERTGCRYLVPEQQMLVHRLTIPAASGADLKDMLGFEVERLTPFKCEETFYDGRLLPGAADGQQSVELYMSPREPLISAIQRLQTWGVQVNVVIPEQLSGEHGLALNLLDVALRPKSVIEVERRSLLQWGIGLAALVLVLQAPLWWQQLEIDNRAELLSGYKLQARDAHQASEQLDQLTRVLKQLSDSVGKHRPAVAVLDELAQVFPDNTIIRQLEINDDQLLINGESAAALELVKLLERSALFEDVRFRSPIAKNARTQMQRFNLSAAVVKR